MSDEAANRGVEYMLQAAVLGDRKAMVYMAKAYESGSGLGSQRYCTATTVRILSCILDVLSLVLKIENREKQTLLSFWANNPTDGVPRFIY